MPYRTFTETMRCTQPAPPALHLHHLHHLHPTSFCDSWRLLVTPRHSSVPCRLFRLWLNDTNTTNSSYFFASKLPKMPNSMALPVPVPVTVPVRLYLILPPRRLATGQPSRILSVEAVDAGKFANNTNLTEIVWKVWKKWHGQDGLPCHYWSARYKEGGIRYKDVDATDEEALYSAYPNNGIDLDDVVKFEGVATLVVNASGSRLDDKVMAKAMKFIKAPRLPKTTSKTPAKTTPKTPAKTTPKTSAKPTKRKATPSEQGPDNKKKATAK